MSRLIPKARLIVVHDQLGRRNLDNNKCYLTERMISGLRLKNRVVVHDYGRFMEYLNAVVSKYSDLAAFVEYHNPNFKITALTEEQQLLIVDKYCRYFTDLKIWLDENPESIIVVQDCSFLEECVFRATNTEHPDPSTNARLIVFLMHFKKLFAEIPTLDIFVKDHSFIQADDVYLKGYQSAFTHHAVVENTYVDYAKVAVAYNLFDFGQSNSQ